MGANDSQGMVNFIPRGMVGSVYERDHLTLLHTKYISGGPPGFRAFFFFYKIHIISL